MRAVGAAAVIALLAAVPARARAQDDGGFIASWLARVELIKRDQPTFITPMFSTTGRLVQAWRSDFAWRTTPDGGMTAFYGNGKGLDMVPFSPVQFVINVPAYAAHREPAARDGYGDWPLSVKYRLVSHGPNDGNDLVTALLGVSIPTGGKANGAQHTVFTPQLAGGKGWGWFDVQMSGGVGVPSSGAEELGHALTLNVAPQYHVMERLWTQLELNATAWRGGTHAGQTQAFISPGFYLGRFPFYQRVGFDAGVGMQIAVTRFHQYDHALNVSLLFPF
jgi:hypothetical protein